MKIINALAYGLMIHKDQGLVNSSWFHRNKNNTNEAFVRPRSNIELAKEYEGAGVEITPELLVETQQMIDEYLSFLMVDRMRDTLSAYNMVLMLMLNDTSANMSDHMGINQSEPHFVWDIISPRDVDNRTYAALIAKLVHLPHSLEMTKQREAMETWFNSMGVTEYLGTIGKFYEISATVKDIKRVKQSGSYRVTMCTDENHVVVCYTNNTDEQYVIGKKVEFTARVSYHRPNSAFKNVCETKVNHVHFG